MNKTFSSYSRFLVMLNPNLIFSIHAPSSYVASDEAIFLSKIEHDKY